MKTKWNTSCETGHCFTSMSQMAVNSYGGYKTDYKNSYFLIIYHRGCDQEGEGKKG